MVDWKDIDKILSLPFCRRIQTISIQKPIFIIGVERSGTTLLYFILANHLDCYWFSRLDLMLVNLPFVNSLIRRLVHAIYMGSYAAVPGKISRSKGLILPSECIPYWKRIFQFGSEENYLVGDDYSDENDLEPVTKEDILKNLRIRLFVSARKRALFKWPGISLKIGYFNALFPDAKFIHVIRDSYENLASLVKAKNHAKKKTGERFWGPKISKWRSLMDLDVIEQASMQVATVLEIVEREVQRLNLFGTRRYLRVRYEDLTGSAYRVVEEVIKFCKLPPCKRIERALSGIGRPTSARTNVTDVMGDTVKRRLNPWCLKYGYRHSGGRFWP